MENVQETIKCVKESQAALDELFNLWKESVLNTRKRSVQASDFYGWVRRNSPNEKEIHSDLRKTWNRKIAEGVLTPITTRQFKIN